MYYDDNYDHVNINVNQKSNQLERVCVLVVNLSGIKYSSSPAREYQRPENFLVKWLTFIIWCSKSNVYWRPK